MDILEKKVDEFKDDLVKSVQELIRIRVSKVSLNPGCLLRRHKSALEYMLDLSEN